MFLEASLLQRIHERASDYDRQNEFPLADYEALQAAGYYKAFVPKQYGGYGLSLEDIAHEQTRLAKAAPATALGINMHQIIVGLGAYMVRHGNLRGAQILKAAAAGKLLGFAISEPANDRVLFGSVCEAEKVADGYLFRGPKVFISMIEHVDQVVTYAQDNSGSEPLSVFALLDRNEKNMIIDPNWNTLGMRATQSQNVTLKDAFAPTDQILAIVPPGPSKDPVVYGIFAHFEILLAATYHGIGQRALELGIETVRRRKSVAQDITYDQDKDIRWRIAEAAIVLDAIDPQIDALARAIDTDTDLGIYAMPRMSALKNRSVEASLKAVEEIVRASGGRSYYNDQELSRLLRDVYAGLFQPSDQESLHGGWANVLLGPIQKA